MGLYYRKELSNGQEIAVWEITESEEELQQACADVGHDIRSYMQITNKQRRMERMAVRLLLDVMQGPHIQLCHTENGRPFLSTVLPFLEGCVEQVSLPVVSIAHTKRFACLLTGPGKKAGIDIECLARNFEAVEKKALHSTEKAFLSSHKQERSRQLAFIWCAKEAVFKYMSIQEVDFSLQMAVAPFVPHGVNPLYVTYLEDGKRSMPLRLCHKELEDHIMVWVAPE